MDPVKHQTVQISIYVTVTCHNDAKVGLQQHMLAWLASLVVSAVIMHGTWTCAAVHLLSLPLHAATMLLAHVMQS